MARDHTRGMRRGSFTSATTRAIVGAIALYALLFQAFLASVTPTLAFDGDHVVCSPRHGAATNENDRPVRHDHGCCTAVQIGVTAPPPATALLAERTAARDASLAWRPYASPPKTGPPCYAQSARGPPPV